MLLNELRCSRKNILSLISTLSTTANIWFSGTPWPSFTSSGESFCRIGEGSRQTPTQSLMATSPISSTPGQPVQSAMTRGDLIDIMREFRSRTLDRAVDHSDDQLIGPRLPTLNPQLWETGHAAWTQELGVLLELGHHQPRMEG